MSRRSFFGSIKTDINNLKTMTVDYHEKLLGFVDSTAGFKEDIGGLITVTTDPDTGLLSRFNCKFLGASIDRVFDAMCVNYVSPVFKVIIAVAIASTSMFFASFFSFTLAIRYARKVRP